MTTTAHQRHWSGSALLAVARVWFQATGAILFLASSVILDPSEFGEFVIAASVYGALAVFVGHGVYEYVMKMHDSATAPVTGFFINMAAAVVMALAAIVISIFLGPIVKSDAVGHLLRLLAPAFILQGCNIIMESVLMRRGHVPRVAISMIVTDTVTLAIALAALGLGAGALALVIQRVSREGVLALVYGFGNRWKMTFAFDAREAKDILYFSGNLVAARSVGMGAAAVTDVVIGAALSTADAGMFRLANRLLNIGTDFLFQPFLSMLWVRLPPLRADAKAFGKLAIEMTEVFGLGYFAIISGMALIANTAMPLLLGEKWQGAVPVVVALAVGRLIAMPNCSAEAILAMKDRTRFLVLSSIIGSVLTVAVIFIAAPHGIVWSGIGVAVVGFLSQFYMLPILARCSHLPISTYINLMMRLTACALLMALAVEPWLLLGAHFSLNGWIQIGGAVLLGAGIYILAARRVAEVGYRAYEIPLIHGMDRIRRLPAKRRPHVDQKPGKREEGIAASVNIEDRSQVMTDTREEFYTSNKAGSLSGSAAE